MITANSAATRRQINTPGFDPVTFLSSQVSTISLDGAEPEKKLLQLFDNLFQHLDNLAQEIEEEVVQLQETAWQMESNLFQDLDEQLDKLSDVGKAVDSVKLSFDHASEGAVRVGGRLAISDRERQNIDRSIEFLSYIEYFENAPDELFSNILGMNSQKLRESLPKDLQNEDWATISKTFHDLRVIAPWDPDTNSSSLRKANKIIDSLASVVEMELLGQFDSTLNDLMEDPENSASIAKAHDLAQSLYLFNGGMALQKRYIFGVIERRIPNDAYYRQDREKGLLSKVKDLALHAQKALKGEQRDSDEQSSAGYSSTEEDATPPELQKHALHSNRQEDHSLALIDLLSGLFQTINMVCVEQFALIRKIFPVNTIPQVTRSLIQRIFSDPAFGIQARVDSILCPTDTARKLPLADYLDALLTVREKLNALYLLLLECCSDPTMRGMGSEGESLRKAKKFSTMATSPREKDVFGRKTEDEHRMDPEEEEEEMKRKRTMTENDEDIEERMRSDIEIREFFEEQIVQVLGGYVNDYFDKELLHARMQYLSALRKAVDDSPALGRISGGTLKQMPVLRAEKMRSISSLVKTVANRAFITSVMSITTDAILRMESIGRDDRKLPTTAKDLFILHLTFLTDGVMIPWARACTTILLKICSTKASNSSLPPMDLLPAVAALIYGKNKIKVHFEESFMRPLAGSPNLVVVCTEARRKAFKSIVNVARECLYAWTLGVAFHIEKQLSSLQSKFDYAPKFDTLNNLLQGGRGYAESTAACDAVCKTIILVTNTLRNYEPQLVGVDMDAMFWKPFGSQCLGNLISHLRKQKVTLEGARMLMRDLQEYKHVMTLMNSREALDMMTCLEEICTIYAAEPQDVAKIVIDEFRHLDTSIVLALVRARADFQGRGSKDNSHWSKVLSTAFMNYKWDSPLPWEARKPFTVMSFSESLQAGNSLRHLGPTSLRKASSNSSSALYKREMLLRSSSVPRERPGSIALRQRSNSGAIALDMAALQSEDAEFHIRAAETDYEVFQRTEELRQQRQHQQQPRASTKFLPSRPDEAEGEGNRASLSAAALTVARPDLIMAKPNGGVETGLHRSMSVDRVATTGIAGNGVSRRGSNTDGAGTPTSAPASTQGQKMNPILAARKSVAGGSSGDLRSNGAPTRPAGEASTSSQPQPFLAAGDQSKSSRTMFNKMSSFFTGQK